MGREYELKYTATDRAQQAIRQAFGGFRRIHMETTYFDTPSRALSSRKMTLRLRKENNKILCTLKTPLPDGSRGEWECPAGDIAGGVDALCACGAPALLKDLTAEGLIPVCGARFLRFAARIPTADGEAELALDSGVLLGGGKEQPLCEVEVELKSGSEEATAALAAKLAEAYGLTEETHSKFRRALALAQGGFHG